MKRRDVVSVGASLAGVAALGIGSGAARQVVQEASIAFNDQTTDGTTLTVERIATDVDARFRILDADSNSIAGPIDFDAGTVVEDYEVELQSPLTESGTVSANLYNTDGRGIARELAEIHVGDGVDITTGFGPTFVERDPEAGFNYPYYLYAPTRTDGEQSQSPSILVQPNNSGQATDEFDVQKQAAESRINNGISRTVADRLSVPLLIPVFPRPMSEPVDGMHYIHALDRQTMQISEGPLERVDRQLLRMVADAKQRLSEQAYPVDDQLMLNGFSAAGNFVDRFTFLHPDRVRSVTAGGLNGTAMLPIEEADGHTLNFHIGIADIEALTGEAVDLEALSETNQYLYMGEDDGNDTIPYDDAWSDEMREIALDVYGENMVADRFPTCQLAYEQAGVDAQFNVYEGVGHSPRPALDDIVEFHRRSLNGEDVSEFGQELGVRPAFDATPTQPAVGDEITFDAGASNPGVGEILAYTWQFADEETAAGQTVGHRFTEAGEYQIRLRIIDSKGRTASTTKTLTVGDESNHGSPASQPESTTEATTTAPQDSATQSEQTTDTAAVTETESATTQQSSESATDSSGETSEETGGSVPGFGIGTAMTGIGGAVYALTQLDTDQEP